MKKKIFCIGSNLESFLCLKYLVEQGCTIHTLITLPAGRNQNVSDYYDLHDFCKTHSIQTIDTIDVNSSETIRMVAALSPDYLFTLGWSQIFKKEFIDSFSGFVVGTHPSKLPHGRGRAPLPWTILEDLRTSAVSFFKIDSGVDTGKLIIQREFKIAPRAYVEQLYQEVAKHLGLGFTEIYRLIASSQAISLSKQEENGVTIRGKRTPSDGHIDFNHSIVEVDRLIRAVSKPYPGAYCYYKNTKIIFWKVAFDKEGKFSGTIGQILARNSNGILVQFSDGTLWLNEPSNAHNEFINLKFFKLGDKLGYNVQDEIFKLKTLSK